ncbi:DUF4214 domain-containing protein, partial [Pseudoroseomonas deserti]|uniref:DUF4214 domain-containing protein n=1 Tax=Teichococcus deserti TaxID=1817963 RepID=UPI001A95C8B5
PPVTFPPVTLPETPVTPQLPLPGGLDAGGVPMPALPDAAVHLVAQASDTLLGSLKLAWQAERNVTDAFGHTHVSVSSGELLWLTPQDQQNLASGRLTLPEMAGASEVVHIDASAPGHAGQGPVLLLWSGGMADGVDLTGALRGLLGDGEVQATLAQRDGGLLLHTLQQVAGGLATDDTPVELHITGPLATPPVAEPVLPGSSAVNQLISLACTTLLDRPADAGDLARWGHSLASGALDARGLVEAILRSDEYQITHADESDRDFVAAVYRHAHATEMDPVTLGHWTELLESHAIDRADLVMAVGMDGHHRDEAMPGH